MFKPGRIFLQALGTFVLVVAFTLVLLMAYRAFLFEPFQTPYVVPQKVLHPQTEVHQPKVVTVLAVDGGGVRGEVPLHVLAYLEKSSGEPTSKLFHLLIGASTGQIIVVGLTVPNAEGKPLLTAKKLARIYMKTAAKTFNVSLWHRIETADGAIGPKYQVSHLYRQVNKFEQGQYLADLLSNVAIPAFDLQNKRPILFTSWGARAGTEYNYPLAPVVAGAAAAPGFFAPVTLETRRGDKKHLLVDGAIILNSPALQGYLLARHRYPNAQIILVSLGNSTADHALAAFMNTHVRRWGVLHWLPHLFKVMLIGYMQMVDRQMKSLMNAPGSHVLLYERYNIDLPVNDQNQFNASKHNMADLSWYGDKLVAAHHASLQALAKLLVAVGHHAPKAQILKEVKVLKKMGPTG
jgi:predicted acylesterase/phospholipase RssA